MEDFGKRTWNIDLAVVRSKTLQELLDGRTTLVNFLGMDMAGMEPQVNSYPLPDGRGGMGCSIYQPFVEPKHIFQPLTTSFMIFDVWPEYFTITIKSCLKFSMDAVVSFVSDHFGDVVDVHFWTLSFVTR